MNRISYEKSMRERALSERKGLYTLEIMTPGTKPGEFGEGITMQGPASESEVKEITAFMRKLIKRRSAAAAPQAKQESE